MFAAPRTSAAALALLIASAPLAYAGGSRNGGSRRAPPPPPPSQPSSMPQRAPSGMARSGPSLQPGYTSGGGLNPGRQNLPSAYRGPTTSTQGTSYAPRNLGSLPRAGSAPGPLNSGAPRYQAPTSNPGMRSLPLPSSPAPASTLSPPPVVRYTPGEWDQRHAAARQRLNQGGVRTGRGGVLPPTSTSLPPSPLQGTPPSSRWDRNVGVPGLVTSPGGASPAPRTLLPAQSRVLTQGPTSGLRRGPLGNGALDGRAAEAPSLLPSSPRSALLAGSSTGGAMHAGGVRRGGSTAPVLGAGLAPASSLPTHSGGVRYGGGSYGPSYRHHDGGHHSGHHAGHHGDYHYGHGWGGPSWGFGCYPSIVNEVAFVNVWGYGAGSCCPPSLPYYAPTPMFAPEPWPAYEPGTYQPPTYLPPAYEAPPAQPAPWPAPSAAPEPEPAPTPVAPPEPPAAPEQAAPQQPDAEQQARDEAALRQAFERMLKAFRSGEYETALAVAVALTQSDPQLGEAWMAAAHSYFALGRYEPAAQALTRAAALRAFPRGYRFDPLPLYGAAEAFDTLRRALDARIQAQPADADARLVRAWLHASQGRRHEAQDDLVQVLTLRPGDEAAPLLALALLPAEEPAAAPGSGRAPSSPAGPLPVEER